MDEVPYSFPFVPHSLTIDPILLRPTNTFHNEPSHTDDAPYLTSSSLAYAPLIHSGSRPLYFAASARTSEESGVHVWPCAVDAGAMDLGDQSSGVVGTGCDGGELTPEDLQPFLPSPYIHYAPPSFSFHSLAAPSYMDTTATTTGFPFHYSHHTTIPSSSLAPAAQVGIAWRASPHASLGTSTSTFITSHADAFLAPPQLSSIRSASSAPGPAIASVHGAGVGPGSSPSPAGFRMLNTPVAGYSHPEAVGAGVGEHTWDTLFAPVSTGASTTPNDITETASPLQRCFSGGTPTTPVSARTLDRHASVITPKYDSDDSSDSFIVVDSSAACAFSQRSTGCYRNSNAETADSDGDEEVDGETEVITLEDSPAGLSIITTTGSTSTPTPMTSPAVPYTPAYRTSIPSSSPVPSSPAHSDGSVYTPSPVGKKRSAGGRMGVVGVTKRARGDRSSERSSSRSSGAGSVIGSLGNTGSRGNTSAGGDGRPKWLIASEAAARARDKAGGKPGTRGRVVTGDFLWKVFIMLTHPKYRKWVKWDPTIRQATVDDTRAFAENVYRRHCSSRKWESFQRNLTNYNAWGFRREVVPGTGKRSQTIFLPTWQRVKSLWESVGGSMETLARAELELPMEEIEGSHRSPLPSGRDLLVFSSESDNQDHLGLESEEESLAYQCESKCHQPDKAQLLLGLHGRLLSPINLVPRMKRATGSGGDYFSPVSNSSVSPIDPFAARSLSPGMGTTFPITPISVSPRISRLARKPSSHVGCADSQISRCL